MKISPLRQSAGVWSLTVLAAVGLVVIADEADHQHQTTVTVRAQTGDNAWNAARPPADWWEEIRRQHGHVGPWNVLGWRIGQTALREFNSEWGRHELEVVCHLPPQTPFTCMLDGVSVGTGNTLGRLDLRLAEVLDYRQCFVSVRRKDRPGAVIEYRPDPAYLTSILNQPVERLEGLSRDCSRRPEAELFRVIRLEVARSLPAPGGPGH
jgi:formylmethanofuran dehydrogenase subunit E